MGNRSVPPCMKRGRVNDYSDRVVPVFNDSNTPALHSSTLKDE